jgi:UDP-3-O-[3-hydroxymyristoyl] glucosamine N-acyltransferase
MEINIIDISNLLVQYNGKIINEFNLIPLTSIKPIFNAEKDSLVFIDTKTKNKDNLIKETTAIVIICDYIPSDHILFKDKCLVVVNNPKLFFAKLVNQQLNNDLTGLHPSAVINSDIDGNCCYIGSNVYIGKNVKIGNNVFIHSNCSIYDNVEIGNNVIIDAGCVIGAAGFGFVRDDETGEPIRFPQLGGVIIEDDVEIGANVCIDRGALQNTIIHKGVKIDNLVQISHNVEIDEYTYIMGTTAIAGSTKIGKRCWIAPSKIMNKITIGDEVTVGYGSVVFKSIPSNKTYIGNPAINIEKYVNMQYKLKKL